jgi:hypothetical protein
MISEKFELFWNRSSHDHLLLSKTSQSKFSLSPAKAERSKDHDGPTADHEGVHVVVHDEAHDGAHDEAHDLLTATEFQILKFSIAPKNTSELLKMLGYRSRTGNYKAALSNLLSTGYLEMTTPASPRSKNQKYRLTQTGKRLMEKQNIDNQS